MRSTDRTISPLCPPGGLFLLLLCPLPCQATLLNSSPLLSTISVSVNLFSSLSPYLAALLSVCELSLFITSYSYDLILPYIIFSPPYFSFSSTRCPLLRHLRDDTTKYTQHNRTQHNSIYDSFLHCP